ncbi:MULTISPECIES: hypothetical protein [Arthrobacter]|uniref:HNH endonuclease n=2 Tax=Arthrobacter TaxID=1663 RepID=A0ABU9KKJ0_9MICC|nr:hypothetical protein [Arthrobacter sp. YJM1]MDP5226312.1 hypothetical protein [Arthrobacter sp. YJM1]
MSVSQGRFSRSISAAVLSTLLAAVGLSVVAVPAHATDATPTPALVSSATADPESAALAQAESTGQPVVVDALTTETSQTTAVPDGKMQAKISNAPLLRRYDTAWYDRGYSTPPGGWGAYDIHHITPREFGGSNDFFNLVPLPREIHKTMFNTWRIGYQCLK